MCARSLYIIDDDTGDLKTVPNILSVRAANNINNRPPHSRRLYPDNDDDDDDDFSCANREESIATLLFVYITRVGTRSAQSCPACLLRDRPPYIMMIL